MVCSAEEEDCYVWEHQDLSRKEVLVLSNGQKASAGWTTEGRVKEEKLQGESPASLSGN